MKQIVISGNIGKDAEVRHTQGGDAVAGFSVAVEYRDGKEKRTEWFDVSLWGKRGEALAQYLTKGSRVSVAGDLGRREYEGKTYLTVRADQVTLMGGGNRDRQDDAPPRSNASPSHSLSAPRPDLDDEIPF